VVLEDYEHAISRGARIYAEIEGWSFTCDAFSMARPESTGKEQTRSIRKSLMNAQWFPEEIDYINACGLGTQDLDLIEVNAIKAGLGESAHKVPVSSLKAALGHAFAASGAFQVIGTALALKHQMIPPTLNLKDPDPSCDLDFVTDIGRPAVVDRALVNSFGFGGKNIVLALSNPNRSVLPDDDRVRRTTVEEPMLVGAVYAGAGQA
jgi:3-oxoacyl-[acyl-carrier-protein] synthase II